MKLRDILTGTLKKMIKLKLIKWSSIAVLILVLVSAVISLLYNSPLAIFLPRINDDGTAASDEKGYDMVAEELEKYYVAFNQEVYGLKDQLNSIVNYSDSHSNFWDVIKIYSCLTYDGVAENSPCILSEQNKALMKSVFDELNTYSESAKTFYYENGDVLGNYKVAKVTGHELYGTDDVYGECIVDGGKMPLVPLDCVLRINNKGYRVVAKGNLSDSAAVAVLAGKGDSGFTGGAYEVSFVSTDEVKKISYERSVIDVSVRDAGYYLANHTLSDGQMEFFAEIESMRGDIFSGSVQDGADSISTPLNLTQQEFIAKVGAAAQENYKSYKILPSLIIAQACLESGYGTTKLGMECFNFFGMKWVNGCGCEYKEYSTQEQSADGTYYTITARFRKYSSFEAGIAGYYDFINYSRYRNLFGETNYETACRLIREDGWATDLSYTQKLIRIIVSYNLTSYDDAVLNGGIPDEGEKN